MRREKISGTRGFALVSTLWIVSLLSVIAISVGASIRSDLKVTQNYLGAVRADQLAYAGVQLAIFDLLTSRQSRKPISYSKSYATGAGQINVEVRDEAGKVDLNTASRGLLETIINTASETKEESRSLVDAIFDWRDTDSDTRPNGAEISSYRSDNISASIKNGKFEFVDELGHVVGVDQNIFRKIKPDVTVLSSKRGIDPRFASTNLISVILGENDAVARQFAESKETNSDRANLTLLRQSGISRRMFSSPTRSSYSISVDATLKSGARRKRDILVTVTKSSYNIHNW